MLRNITGEAWTSLTGLVALAIVVRWAIDPHAVDKEILLAALAISGGVNVIAKDPK